RFLETRERLTYEVLYGLYGNDWYKHFPTDKDVYEKRLIHFYLNDEIVWTHPDYTNITIPSTHDSVHIYPNILDNESMIISSTPLQQIQIYDVSGRLVLNCKVNGKTYQCPG
ncbi:MAG: T9SS type A sorting domain-containing protein, partial [Dysgonamonadaceae bacterium]|nr:T9SS type A sorting domain-containing protein [Dysgonamonadaceae bacterium]